MNRLLCIYAACGWASAAVSDFTLGWYGWFGTDVAFVCLAAVIMVLAPADKHA